MLFPLLTQDAVLEALQDVIDPELGLNIVDLGLIRTVTLAGPHVEIDMTLTTPGCPMGRTLVEAARRAVATTLPGVATVTVHLVFEPPWQFDDVSAEGRAALGC